MKYDRKKLINACNQALRSNADVDITSARYVDIECRIRLDNYNRGVAYD